MKPFLIFFNSMNPFYLQNGNIYGLPVIHYNMEFSVQVRNAFLHLQPDCVVVELAETMQLQLLHAASRLPDISVVIAHNRLQESLYYMCEPCDPAFEALRSGLEAGIATFCIDLDVDFYPDIREVIPDPYAINRIGFKQYYECYAKTVLGRVGQRQNTFDASREMYMARRLKELSFSYERILFVGGMSHVENVLRLVNKEQFPDLIHAKRDYVEICTLTEESCREVMCEYGWISRWYEEFRKDNSLLALDRQKLIFSLFKTAAKKYTENTGNVFPGYHMRNIMKFARNYAFITDHLMADLYQLLSVARGCVDSNYAYETWLLATEYPYLRNIDGLPQLNLSVEEIWKHSKMLRFHLKQPNRKGLEFRKRKKDNTNIQFKPPSIFGICSYQPEDKLIEGFGDFLKKKGVQITVEQSAKTVPFTNSLEDGVDVRETLRHWVEKKLYVKTNGKPPGGVGSVVVILDEDVQEEGDLEKRDKYPWCLTWIGEHEQESDMAFYATSPLENVVGPGISRCEYGGFMMSYPPRRLKDVWTDPDYEVCRTKAEVLLAAAIDYAIQPLVVYLASKPPRSALKSFAQRFGKKIVYVPIGQISPLTINKIRSFHVLDGHDKRSIAGEYIY